MKLTPFITLGFLFFSFQSFGSNLIKLHDGTLAKCDSRYDFFRHNLSGVYRPVRIERNEHTATITVEYLRCDIKAEGFGFTRDRHVEDRMVVLERGSMYSEDKVLRIQRNDLSLVAFSHLGEVVDRRPLVKNADGTFTATISIFAQEYDNSPEGRKSIEISVQSLKSIDDYITGKNIDRGSESLGFYRLIIE